MPDVREILEEGADINPGLPDVAELVRRGQAARRRRTAAVAAAVAGGTAVVALVAALLAQVVLPSSRQVLPAPAPSVPATPLPSVTGPLAPGTYDASSTGTDLRFKISGRGWTLATADQGWLSLRHGRTTVGVHRWDEVVDPAADPVGPTDTVPLPEDLVAWLSAHPRLDVAGVEGVRVGGRPWTAVDVAVEQPLSTTPDECNTLPCVLLAVSGDEPTELLARDRARVLVPDGPRTETRLVVLVSFPASRSAPDPAVDALLASISTT